MVPDATGPGRRPTLATFVGNHRQMLQGIQKNLSHLRTGPDVPGVPAGIAIPMKADGIEEKHSSTGSNSSARDLKYTKAALAQIKQSLEGYEISEPNTTGNLPNGSAEVNPHMVQKLKQMGYDEELAIQALSLTGNRNIECALGTLRRPPHGTIVDNRNGFTKMATSGLPGHTSKVVRKPSFEDKYQTGSSVNSESSSIRSDSPTAALLQLQSLMPLDVQRGSNTQNQAVPGLSAAMERITPPPPLPPRGMQPNGRGITPPPPPPNSQGLLDPKAGRGQQQIVQDMFRRMAPLQMQDSNMRRPTHMQLMGPHGSRVTQPQRGLPMPCQPVIVQNTSPHNQAQGRHLQTNVVVQSNGSPNPAVPTCLLPHYSVVSNMQSPSVPHQLYDQSQVNMVPNDGSPLSSHSPSPAPTPVQGVWPSPGAMSPGQGQNGQWVSPRPTPMQAWSARQPPIFMQQANSREVHKPILQTATAPLSPPQPIQGDEMDKFYYPSQQMNYVSSVQAQVNTPQVPPRSYKMQSPAPPPQGIPQPPHSGMQIEITHQPTTHPHPHNVPPRRTEHTGPSGPQSGHPGTIQIHIQNQQANMIQIQRERGFQYHPGLSQTPNSTPRSESPVPRMMNQSPMSIISTNSTPSTNSDIPDKPPPPYPGFSSRSQQQALQQALQQQQQQLHTSSHQEDDYKNQTTSEESRNSPSIDSNDTDEKASVSSQSEASSMTSSEMTQQEKHLCSSPKPQRKADAQSRDAERRETQVRHFSPQAYKFYIEQHVENVIKCRQQREHRRVQLESEMDKVGLSEEASAQMRKMLHQKESNYIRLKRAKMDKCMFQEIKILGIGAFGEVALVRKKDTGYLYAMKKLRKRDVLQKNQVAHVKAERDILAEADNEWVVKLYFSFQDKDNLYFVMDYIPGGDMMSLLIKFGIFEESLARFYIAELVLAIESVHRMGFIHRDIKPDNILIDKDGHIKLTDFGLCTGFRWTHNSKYYQKGNHARQDSMDPVGWTNSEHDDCSCEKEVLKPLERRKLKHQRCLAHSLVGTPNYIAPEVLLREGYKRSCDWWSVGVILYEMLVGQPPFLANTPAETQMKVINWCTTLHIPSAANLSESARDLILSLCCSSERRMGNNDVDDIKGHRFFNGISFEGLRQQKAPYVPQIRSPTDTSNFDPVDQEKLRDSESGETLKRDGIYENGKHPEHAFLEFTFRRFFDECGHPFMPRLHEDMIPTLLEIHDQEDVDEGNESNSPVYV